MNHVILILAFAIFGLSCTKTIDKTLEDQVTSESFWKSATDLELYVNQFYPSFIKTSQRGTAYYEYDLNSDNEQPIAPSEILNGTRAIPATGGGWNWTNIRDINIFFENKDRVSTGAVQDINQYVGEGYFFRAFFYFDLLKRFGDLPWYSKSLDINSDALQDPRLPRNQIADSILADLDNAINLLREKDQLPSNRVNRGAALLMKSRVALYEGTWEKYHEGDVFGVKNSNGHKYLEIAAAASQKLMDNGNFRIFSSGHPDEDYRTLFSSDNLSGNPEILLLIPVDGTLGLGTWSWTYLNGSRGAATGITKSLVDSYLSKDNLPITLSAYYEGDTTVQQVVENRDPRLSQTIWVPGQIQISSQPPQIYKNPSLSGGEMDLSTTAYMIRKGSTTDPSQNTGSSSDLNGEVDGIVFRYAESLLNYAEAKAELGTIDQVDLDKSINILRDRVAMPHLSINVGYNDPAWEFPNLSPILNEIRRERRVELALEGFRYDDLMRWAAADLIKGKRLKGARFVIGKSFPEIENRLNDLPVDANRYIDRYFKTVPNGFKFNENRDYLYPIPTNELTLNKNLTQNPGW
jgi:hypothetical protein